MQVNLSLVGRYEFFVRRKGEVVLSCAGKNLMVSTGKNRAAGVLANTISPPLGGYLAFGDDATPADLAQTALISEIGSRTLLSISVLSNFFSQTGTITNAGAPLSVREMGLFTAAAAGTMISRWVPNAFTFGTGDSLDFSWTLEVG